MRRFKPSHPCAFPAVLNAAWAATGYGLGYVMQDPDAIAYVAAVKAAGATVTNTQRTAIDAFVTTGKSDGWYSSIKRLYLPIWASHEPNAIDMISRTSGTFVGGVTPAPGYVQGNGTAGYFDFGVSPSGLGLTSSNQALFALCAQAPTDIASDVMVSASQSSTQVLQIFHSAADSGNTVTLHANQFAAPGFLNATMVRASQNGIFVGSYDGTTRRLSLRSSAGFSTLASAAGAVAGTIPTGNLNALRSPLTGGVAYSSGRYGSWGATLVMSGISEQAFTLNLKTLWETCTGLTLP